MMWRQIYPEWAKKLGIDYDIRTKHYSEILSEKIRSGEFRFPQNGWKPTVVSWHDSCHIGRVSGVYEEPRDVIKAIPNIEFREMSHNHENAHCCGSVLTLLKEPPVAADIGKTGLTKRLKQERRKCSHSARAVNFSSGSRWKRKSYPLRLLIWRGFPVRPSGTTSPTRTRRSGNNGRSSSL